MTRMTPLTAILLSKLFGGGGGSVTAAAVLAAMEAMNSTQAEDALEAIGGEAKPTTVTVSGTTPSIAAEANHIYECGELTSLTVSSFPATGKFWIWFTSGATATTTTGISNFTAEANKVYRIFVENGYATYDSWATS